MSRVIQHDQYSVMLTLRDGISRAVAAGDPIETHTATGRLQGYLLGLQAAGEIDNGDVEALEADMLSGISFLVNARKVGNGH